MPKAIRAASRGRRRPPSPARRLVPGRDPRAARARRDPTLPVASSRWSRARSTSPRSRWSRRCGRSPRSPGLGHHAALPRAGRRARAAGQARLPARGLRQVPDEAVDDLSNLHDRELLAQIEAVDAFMGRMHAYPGRTFGQLYHRFFRTNDLADGRLALEDGTRRPRRREECRCSRSRAAATGSRRSRLPPRRGALPHAASSSPPRRAATSACSPAAPRPGRPGGCSTASSTARACKAACKAREAAGGRGLSGYPAAMRLRPALRARPPARPRRARRRPGAADRARHQGRPPRRRRPHRAEAARSSSRATTPRSAGRSRSRSRAGASASR